MLFNKKVVLFLISFQSLLLGMERHGSDPAEEASRLRLQAEEIESLVLNFTGSLVQQYQACSDIYQKIAYASKLFDCLIALERSGAPKDILDTCKAALHFHIHDIRSTVSHLLDCKPFWFNDPSWEFAQAGLKNFDLVISKLDRVLRCPPISCSDAEKLYQARNAFQEISRQVQDQVNMGLDHVARQGMEITRRQHHIFQDALKQSIAVIDYFIQWVQSGPSACPAAQFIRTCATPQCISNNRWKKLFFTHEEAFVSNRELWENYLQVRDFVIANYMTATGMFSRPRMGLDTSDHDIIARNLVRL